MAVALRADLTVALRGIDLVKFIFGTKLEIRIEKKRRTVCSCCLLMLLGKCADIIKKLVLAGTLFYFLSSGENMKSFRGKNGAAGIKKKRKSGRVRENKHCTCKKDVREKFSFLPDNVSEKSCHQAVGTQQGILQQNWPFIKNLLSERVTEVSA